MNRHLLTTTFWAAAIATVAACGGEMPDEDAYRLERETYFRRPYPDGRYVMTTFGGPSDPSAYGQKSACGERVYGNKYYSTGVYGWGCNAKVRLTANGKCVVVRVIDNGPAAWVESRAASRCGVGRVLDISPLASRHLFGVSNAGWSECRMINVERVSNSLPEGPCSSGGSWNPPALPATEGASCQIGSQTGICKNTNTSTCATGFKSGYCAGASNIKCCLNSTTSTTSTTVGVGTSCTIGSQRGTCLDANTSTCASGFKSGYCAGPSNVKCCLPSTTSTTVTVPGEGASCQVGSQTGVCKNTSTSTCATGFKTGYCPGASNIKCCLN